MKTKRFEYHIYSQMYGAERSGSVIHGKKVMLWFISEHRCPVIQEVTDSLNDTNEMGMKDFMCWAGNGNGS